MLNGLDYNFLNRKVKDITIEDALEGYYEHGIDFICGDGKLRRLISHPRQTLIKILMREVN